MMTGKLSPSMMCADFAHLPQTLEAFGQAGVEYLHVDVMDGEFVSNFTWERISAMPCGACAVSRWIFT